MVNVGAHASIAGGVANAVDAQVSYGGTCGQLFTHSPQVWDHGHLEASDAAAFRAKTAEHNIGPWVIHASYLVNIASPKPELRARSVESLQQELDAAARLTVPYVNVHLGAHTGAGVETGLTNAAAALDDLEVPDGVTVLLETDAGSGTRLGGRFEELAAVRDSTDLDVGVCLDTAHTFVAGYDLSTPTAVAETIEEFDAVVGLEALRCLHLNDSKHPCGSHRDEHAHVGDGSIGDDGLQAVLTHPATRSLPFVLETPTEDGRSFAWNIQRVRELAAT